MNRSRSPIQSNKPNRSPQPRTIYLNQESTKRDNSTPFHSPYKDGKPNPQYYNPSFVSNHLFYGKQMANPSQSKVQVTTNLIPNRNDRKKQALYRERIQRQESVSPLKKSQRVRQYTQYTRNNRSQVRILRSNQPEVLLKNELNSIHNYRETMQQKNDRFLQISRKRNDEPKEPIYLQKKRLTPSRNSRLNNDQNLEELTREIRMINKQMKNLDGNHDHNIDRLIEMNKQTLQQEHQRHRLQSELLGNILREQIKLSKPLKQRRWNY